MRETIIKAHSFAIFAALLLLFIFVFVFNNSFKITGNVVEQVNESNENESFEQNQTVPEDTNVSGNQTLFGLNASTIQEQINETGLENQTSFNETINTSQIGNITEVINATSNQTSESVITGSVTEEVEEQSSDEEEIEEGIEEEEVNQSVEEEVLQPIQEQEQQVQEQTQKEEPKQEISSSVTGKSVEEENKTEEKICIGCLLKEDCYPFDKRKKGKYCSTDKTWINQSAFNETCYHNFECLSNSCEFGKCGGMSFFQKILYWISKLGK